MSRCPDLRPGATVLGMTNAPADTAFPDIDHSAVEDLFRSTSLPPLLDGDPGIADEVAAFNAAVRHRPAVVVRATCTDDVVAAVRFAARVGLPVAVQATGHGAVTVVDGAVLVTTSRLGDVSVDPAACTARIGAGVTWARVIEAAAPYGLAPMSGSSSGVGAIGYTLGGGLGPLGRKHGYSADHVLVIEVVTGDGVARRVTAESEPELFWGLRGGKGNFGIVTAMEVALLPVPELYAGNIVFAGRHAADVLRRWRTWTADLPEETSTSIALMRLPDAPDVPEPLRGRLSVHVRVAHCGDVAEGERLLEPMRTVAPALADTVRVMPFTESDSIHQDPTHPIPFWEAGRALTDLPREAVDAMLATVGPDVEAPLVMVELRLLGGALGRPAAVPNAVSGRAAAYSLFALGLAVPGLEEGGRGAAARLLAALAPWDAGTRLLNFLGAADPVTVARVWDVPTAERLVRLASVVDPHGLFRVGPMLPRRSGEPASAP